MGIYIAPVKIPSQKYPFSFKLSLSGVLIIVMKAKQMTDWLTDQLTNQPIDRLTNWLIQQPAHQPTN